MYTLTIEGFLKYSRVSGVGILLLMFLMLQSEAMGKEHEASAVRDSLVKIYTVNHKPDYYNPWRMLNMVSLSGSGAIIADNKILTNAHVVADHKFIQVRRHGQADKFKAKVLWVSHAADLALLTIEDKDFFEGTTPLEFGPMPESQKEAIVYGFPIGGDSLSITKGVLSRIEHQVYTHSSNYFLAGQLDAAINPGNSGGPVLVDGKIVGVVMQKHGYDSSENIGYMVPVPIIQHFLEDVRDGNYDGFPDICIVTQHMENPAIKKRFGLPEELTGVLVNHICVGSVAEGKLLIGDILLAVDGHDIADNSSVEFRLGERTEYSHFIDLHQINDVLDLKVFRDNKIKHIKLELTSTGHESLLVPMEQYGKPPRFFVFGGLVITQLTKNVVTRWGSNWKKDAPREFVLEMSEWAKEDKREALVILQVLPADVNIGYHGLGTRLIDNINGKKIKNLEEAAAYIFGTKEKFLVFTIDREFKVVIDREEALKGHQDILDTYHITSDRSQDLLTVKQK